MDQYNHQIKKRIMFNKESDYYFIAYNSLLILHTLSCYEGKSNFYDYRKLIYILPFIADKYLLQVVTKNSRLREEEIKLLEDIHIKAKLREPILKSILFTLEKKGYLTLEKNNTRKSIDVKLTRNSIKREFFKSDMFNTEIQNINSFKSYYQRLSFLSIESLIEKLFKERGVIIWDV
ncbi:hypothetical protein ACFVRR_24095 [Gottfriedia sp. NPDC057948]|uniref:hypothetical protein n=1 Tax=Gottfriedia sp. NPDC057948 TaxID=3346287 RepID=UPI0036D84ADE